MSFLQPQIEHGNWIEVDGPAGTEWIDADLVGDDVQEYHGPLANLPESISMYCENRQAWKVKLVVDAWGARLSAPGFMDCTPWTVFKTEEEAQKYLEEQQDDE